MLVEELTAVVIGISMLLSALLFGVEVFVKRRMKHGQVMGFVFSVLTVPLYLIAFSDKLPGHAIGLRDALHALPSLTKADVEFSSSVIVLVALLVTYVIRMGVYIRLFVIPALTLTEAEYNRRDQVEQRVNDIAAPYLAFLTFALVVTAIVAGAYALPAAAGAGVCVGLVMLYIGLPVIYRLERSIQWLVVHARIAWHELLLVASTLLIYMFRALSNIDRWRRQQLLGDERSFRRTEERLLRSQRKFMAKIQHERDLLRKIAAQHEGVDHAA